MGSDLELLTKIGCTTRDAGPPTGSHGTRAARTRLATWRLRVVGRAGEAGDGFDLLRRSARTAEGITTKSSARSSDWRLPPPIWRRAGRALTHLLLLSASRQPKRDTGRRTVRGFAGSSRCRLARTHDLDSVFESPDRGPGPGRARGAPSWERVSGRLPGSGSDQSGPDLEARPGPGLGAGVTVAWQLASQPTPAAEPEPSHALRARRTGVMECGAGIRSRGNGD